MPDGRPVSLVPSRFEGPGREGDFAWMITRPEHADALFVFNDNEEQFRAFRRDPSERAGLSPGAGNAVIRPHRGLDPPRAAGIPTGRAGHGYPALTPDVRAVIDEALDVIAELLATGTYGRVVYSAAGDDGTDGDPAVEGGDAGDGDLGTGIFVVGGDVKRYIVSGLRRLVAGG